MLFDLIIGGLLLLFIGLGAWRGALASGLSLVSLVGGYATAIVAASHGGPAVAAATGLAEGIAPIVAGSIGFFAAAFAVGAVGFFLKRMEADRRGGEPRSGVDRFGGAVFGGLRGSVICALVAWVGLLASAAKDLTPEGPIAAAPSAEGSLLAGVTESAIEQVVETALGDDPASRVVARLAARPGERIRKLQQLLDSPSVHEVQGDAFFWTLVENGASDRALNRGSFYRVAHSAELRATFADLGLVSEAAAGDSNAFRDELRVVLDEAGPRIKGLKDDPEIQALARDPEILGLLESGDTVALFSNAKIRALASRLAAGAGASSSAVGGTSELEPLAEAPPSRVVAKPSAPQEPEISDEDLRAAILKQANLGAGPASPAR